MLLPVNPGQLCLLNIWQVASIYKSSYVIGDRLTDVELAKNLGCKAIFINSEKSPDAVLSTNDWNDIYKYLKQIPRTAIVEQENIRNITYL